jgi:fatty-acyl-CoA synthase
MFPGIRDASVYGVTIPGRDGRAGMAAIVTDDSCDLAGLGAHLSARLPEYARPLFLRLQREIDVTGTFKQRKINLVSEGFDPATTSDPIYFSDPAARRFVPLDEALRARILSGEVRL